MVQQRITVATIIQATVLTVVTTLIIAATTIPIIGVMVATVLTVMPPGFTMVGEAITTGTVEVLVGTDGIDTTDSRMTRL